MAENSEDCCRGLAKYIAGQIGITIDYVDGIPWQERERLFDRGEIQLLWICGLPYVQKADSGVNEIELLAVPVPMGERYQHKPVYFSDVVVRSTSTYRSFLELRGARWAFNEPLSHSGFNVVRTYLADLQQSRGFFREAVASGAHRTSLKWLLADMVDGIAIDSTVLEWLSCERAQLSTQIRVIQSIGPSPVPPWVVSTKVPAEVRTRLRRLLCEMHQTPIGGSILRRARLERFVPAVDDDYDPIRRMARHAESVILA
jgi:phosphonate transport system substrate-binding protein